MWALGSLNTECLLPYVHPLALRGVPVRMLRNVVADSNRDYHDMQRERRCAYYALREPIDAKIKFRLSSTSFHTLLPNRHPLLKFSVLRFCLVSLGSEHPPFAFLNSSASVTMPQTTFRGRSCVQIFHYLRSRSVELKAHSSHIHKPEAERQFNIQYLV